MDTHISRRRDSLNTVILLCVVIIMVQVVRATPMLQQYVSIQIVAMLTSVGAYRAIVVAVLWVVNRWDFALRLYWGDPYLKGLWSYEYTLNNVKHIGVWDIRQDVNGITIVGTGIDGSYRPRTIVRSVSPLIPDGGGYYVINARNELTHGNAEVFSKTTLLLDRPSFWHGARSMRGITEVFGGPTDKQLHPDVQFVKHADVDTIEALIERLRQERNTPAAGDKDPREAAAAPVLG